MKKKQRTGFSRNIWKIATAALVAVGAFTLWARAGTESRQRDDSEAPAAPVAARPATLVRYTEAREMSFYETISADGEMKARNYALVSPKITGVIDDVFVREGDPVVEGVTELFQIDNLKLRQTAEHARQSVAIARSSLNEKRANLVKADADLAQADKDYERQRSLYQERVVTLSEFEAMETKVVQLEAERDVAETGIALAEQNVTLAEINLDMAEKDLRDSIVYAPINGVISARYSEPGEMGAPGGAVLRIDGRDDLKAVCYLPGQYYPRIRIGDSVAKITIHGKELGEFPITHKAPGIDSSLRTFEIWAGVPGDGQYAVFGAQCDMNVALREEEGVGVPRDAIQFRDGKYWVFVPDGDRARMIEVKPGLDTDGWTHVAGSGLKPGDRVVTEGQFLLNDGNPIEERKR